MFESYLLLIKHNGDDKSMKIITREEFVYYYNILSNDPEVPYDRIPFNIIDGKLMNKIFKCNNYVIDYLRNEIKLCDIPSNKTILQHLFDK